MVIDTSNSKVGGGVVYREKKGGEGLLELRIVLFKRWSTSVIPVRWLQVLFKDMLACFLRLLVS